MRILLVTPWDDTIGGLSAVVTHVASHLKRRGHRVLLFHLSESEKLDRRTTTSGFPGSTMNLRSPFYIEHPLRSVAGFLWHLPSTIVRLLRFLRSEQIDVINIHYPTHRFVAFVLCSKLIRIPLVTSIHGADVFKDSLPRPHYGPLVRFILRNSDLIVAPSNGYLHQVLSAYPELRRTTQVIYNGVDMSELYRSTAAGSHNVIPYVLCVAALNRRKGLDVLIRAAAQIREAGIDLRIVIAGDGPLRNELEELASQMGVAHFVQFLGRQSHEKVAELLSGCTVFVLPSRSESFGIAIVEAMACGKPVVACRVGGIPEIITDGHDGLLIPPDDPGAIAHALQLLMRNSELRFELGKRAFATVQKRFQWEHTVTAYERAFLRLVPSQNQSSVQSENAYREET